MCIRDSLRVGLHTCYNGIYNRKQDGDIKQILKKYLSSDCTLQLECMKLELLVIADQRAAVNTFPAFVHTARHAMKVGSILSRWPNLLEGAVQSEISDWGEVVTR